MNTYGKNIRLSVFGESHGVGIGIVIDGLPVGVKLDLDYINAYMARRKSDGKLGTKRIEQDIPEIISGVYRGYTTGSPLAIVIKNNCNQSSSYTDDVVIPRPSHADYQAHIKYKGYADMRGGGHFSGRLTANLVFAGAICTQILSSKGITIGAHLSNVAGIKDKDFNKVSINKSQLEELKQLKIPLIDKSKEQEVIDVIERARDEGDSVAGIIECATIGIDTGIGSPFFESLESHLSSILFSVPGVKGVEFGLGFDFIDKRGSQVNDEYIYEGDCVKTKTNNNGGIVGGLSSGMPIVFKCIIKPTPSIFKEQNSINLKTLTNEKMEITGRHDPCIALRALPVIECVTAIAVLDMIMDV